MATYSTDGGLTWMPSQTLLPSVSTSGFNALAALVCNAEQPILLDCFCRSLSICRFTARGQIAKVTANHLLVLASGRWVLPFWQVSCVRETLTHLLLLQAILLLLPTRKATPSMTRVPSALECSSRTTKDSPGPRPAASICQIPGAHKTRRIHEFCLHLVSCTNNSLPQAD